MIVAFKRFRNKLKDILLKGGDTLFKGQNKEQKTTGKEMKSMKKVIVAIMLTMALFIGVSKSFAATVEFEVVDLFDWGRTYAPGAGGWIPTNINPYDGSAGNPMPYGVPGMANGTEDTFGIAQVDQISLLANQQILWDKDVPGSGELTVLFWGFDDDYMSAPNFISGSADIGAIGGHIQMWYDITPDYNALQGTAGRSNPMDPSFFNTVTQDGVLMLDMIATPQNMFGHTLVSQFNFNTNTGSGAVYLDVTGLGMWDYLFDTNTQNGKDFLFQYTVYDNQNPVIANWIVRGDGRAEGGMVPEPGTIILMGAGLIGVALAGHRRFIKK